ALPRRIMFQDEDSIRTTIDWLRHIWEQYQLHEVHGDFDFWLVYVLMNEFKISLIVRRTKFLAGLTSPYPLLYLTLFLSQHLRLLPQHPKELYPHINGGEDHGFVDIEMLGYTSKLLVYAIKHRPELQQRQFLWNGVSISWWQIFLIVLGTSRDR